MQMKKNPQTAILVPNFRNWKPIKWKENIYINIAKNIQRKLWKILDGFLFYGDYLKTSYSELQQKPYYVVKILQEYWNPDNMVKQNENGSYLKICQEIWGRFKRKMRKDSNDKRTIKM